MPGMPALLMMIARAPAKMLICVPRAFLAVDLAVVFYRTHYIKQRDNRCKG